LINNLSGEKLLDIVTLIRYNLGTVRNCESGLSPSGGQARFLWEERLARKKDMTLVAAKKPQLRKKAARDWSRAKASRFLTVLADTCNVSEACRRSGVPMTVAYRRRKMDAGFRAEWMAVIAIAYSRLELMLLDRAFSGTEKVIRRKDGSEERMRHYSDALALALLKMHRDTAAEADSDMPEEDVDEIRERLVKKLQRLKKRDEEQEAQRAELRRAAPRDGGAGGGDAGAATPGP
jgi:hypothetical protein